MQRSWIKCAVLLIAAMCLPLSACGKKGAPKPPAQVEADKEKKTTE